MSRRYWEYLALLFVLASGCSLTSSEDEYSDVTGIVTVQGTPLKSGNVLFQPSSGPFVTGEIQPDGTYHLKAKVGANVVMVVPVNNKDDGADVRDNKVVRQNVIPEKYSSPQSTLKFEVNVGDNQADFDLK